MIQFLKDNNINVKEALIAGNSVGVDKSFIDIHMPLLRDYLHYRVVDVTCIKELSARWNTKVFKGKPHKKECHRAKEDIMESIAELKYYKNSFFKI